MIHLKEYIKICEGGLAGHMAHPIDYIDFTANDLIELVNSLFYGKIEDMKEKLDGFNLNATMNENGEVKFLRNNADLNNENGGMSIADMNEKWAEREQQKRIFTNGGRIITEVFKRLPIKFFNPDPMHRKVINCEVMAGGKTNTLLYASDRVAFHGYKMYTRGMVTVKEDGKKVHKEGWVEESYTEGNVKEIYKAAEGIDEAKPRPNLVLRSAKEAIKFAEQFTKNITKLWESEGLSTDATIDEWKIARFKHYAPEWCNEDMGLYNRLFNDVKSGESDGKTLVKKYSQIPNSKFIDKELKDIIVPPVIKPIDNLFLSIGNELIDQLDGFVNTGIKDKVLDTIKADLEDTIKQVEASNSDAVKNKLKVALERLKMLGDKYNAAEGVVFTYKGRLMKLTGSFAPINQALGTRYDLEK